MSSVVCVDEEKTIPGHFNYAIRQYKNHQNKGWLEVQNNTKADCLGYSIYYPASNHWLENKRYKRTLVRGFVASHNSKPITIGMISQSIHEFQIKIAIATDCFGPTKKHN